MKCEKCGTEFQEGMFCPECGNKCVVPNEQETSSNVADSVAGAAKMVTASIREGVATAIRVAALLLVIAMAFFFWHMHWLVPNKNLQEEHIVDEFFTYVYHVKNGNIIYANVIETSHNHVCVRYDFCTVNTDGAVYVETVSVDYYADGWFKCVGYDSKISATLTANLVLQNDNGGKTVFKKATKEDVEEYERIDKSRYQY